MSEELKFSLERQEILVSIEGGGEVKTYTLKEADGNAAIHEEGRG